MFFKDGTSNQHPTPSVFDLSFHVNGLSFSLGSSAAADAAAIGLGIPSLMFGPNKKKRPKFQETFNPLIQHIF